MKRIIFSVGVLLTALASAVAGAQAMQRPAFPIATHDLAPIVPLDDVSGLIESASHGQAAAVSVFRGPDGLTGVVFQTKNAPVKKGVAWVTPGADAIVVNGSLIGRNGEDLTQAAMYAQGVMDSPASILTATALPAVQAITVGKSGPTVAVFFDPNCIFCHLLHQALNPLVAAGKLRVRYVVVGTLKESSIPRAASILMAKDPAAALDRDEREFNKTTEEGGYPIASELNPAAKSAVLNNNDLFGRAGAQGTPALLFCSKASGRVEMSQGMPSDLHKFVADLDEESRCLTSKEKTQ